MESQISLALAAKLARIFENDASYLSFPLGTGFSLRYLGFMKSPDRSGLSLQEQVNNKADFARLLNIVPNDSAAFSNDASRLLWQRLEQVLAAASFPSSGLTASEDSALAKAIDLLTDTARLDDGTEIAINSPTLNRYYEYKTLHDQAEAAYLDEKITVELSTGPEGEALRRRWAEYREKQLRDAWSLAEANWNNLGFRQQVQTAQRVRNDLEPKRDLSLYRTSYLSDIELSQVPDLNAMGLAVCTTFFSPLDAFEPGTSWNRVTLTRAEMASLVEQAPPALRAIFGSGETSGDFESVSLEYSNVAVIRPWFRPEFFASRTWKLGSESRVSDGSMPRQGEIPAYITSMLVARNVVIQRRRSQVASPMILPIIGLMPLQQLKVGRQTPLLMVPVAGAAVQAVPSGKALVAGVAQAKGSVATLGAGKVASVVSAKPLMTQVAAKPVAETKASATLTANPSVMKKVLLQREFADAKYAGTTIKTPPAAPTAPPPPAPDLVEERNAFDGVIVLAWVCKRVPKCPDPDPALAW